MARILVFKGDGGLMSLETARERPVETILSGPAASLMGGKALSQMDDCVVVDVGGTSTDIAFLEGQNIDWQNRVISFARKKTGSVAVMRFDDEMAEILRSLPLFGPLFPYLRSVRATDRGTEFKQRCNGLGIKGVTLHSYRYAWAERAKTAGYPERFAQEALGHNSKAVHRAYARKAKVELPSLGEFERQQKLLGENRGRQVAAQI